VAWWKLDEMSGSNLADSAQGGHYPATLNGQLPAATVGSTDVPANMPAGSKSVTFNGVLRNRTGECAACVPAAALNGRTFSVSAWVKPYDYATDNMEFFLGPFRGSAGSKSGAIRQFQLRRREGGEKHYTNHSLSSYYDRFWNTNSPVFIERRSNYFAQGCGAITRGSQLCFSSTGVIAQVTQDARDYFDSGGSGWGTNIFLRDTSRQRRLLPVHQIAGRSNTLSAGRVSSPALTANTSSGS